MFNYKSQTKPRYTDTTCQYEVAKNIVCASPLTEAQVKYCEENKERFGGKMYCFGHQKQKLNEKPN